MRLTRKTSLFLIAIAMLCAIDSQAQSSNLTLDRSAAIANARSVDTRLTVNQLIQSGALSDAEVTLEKLRLLSQRVDWPLAARELAIYQFTQSLAALPRHEVDPAILEYLTHYQPQVLVNSDEHAGDLIPLFNVRAAASGIQNLWMRLDSAQLATEIINIDPSDFLALFTQAQNPVVRSGYLDALRQADSSSTQTIGANALEQLSSEPQLSAVVAMIVQLDGHEDTLKSFLLAGQGAQMATTLREYGAYTSRYELANLLRFAIENAPAENAALAIASWWPVLIADQPTRQLLVNTLPDPALGSAAALALANQPNVQTIHQLQQLAKGDSLTAKRAQMSLDLNRQALLREQSQ